MKIFTLNQAGHTHKTHTEDHLFHTELGQNWFIGAVMDGCSSGKESHFASVLIGKLIRKACNTIPFLERIKLDFNMDQLDHAFIGKYILHQVFIDLKQSKQLLSLDPEEILTTLLLMVFHKTKRSAWINISGDGLITHNNEILEIDQQNIPDYIAYHLDIEFEKWIGNFSKTFTFENVENLAISSDGVSKFFSPSERKQRVINPEKFLLTDSSMSETPDMLENKCASLKEDHGLIPYDDLGIIRLIP